MIARIAGKTVKENAIIARIAEQIKKYVRLQRLSGFTWKAHKIRLE